MFKKSLPNILAQFTRLQGDLDQVISDNYTSITSNNVQIDTKKKEINTLEVVNDDLNEDIAKARRIKSRLGELLA
jgi:hypothetical protein